MKSIINILLTVYLSFFLCSCATTLTPTQVNQTLPTLTKSTYLSAEQTQNPVMRTSAGLRDLIFDEIDAIRNGSSNPTRANAVAKLATGIVETVRMEIEVQRHIRSVGPTGEGSGNFLGNPIALGVEA